MRAATQCSGMVCVMGASVGSSLSKAEHVCSDKVGFLCNKHQCLSLNVMPVLPCCGPAEQSRVEFCATLSS